jgi:hypothetical protein
MDTRRYRWQSAAASVAAVACLALTATACSSNSSTPAPASTSAAATTAPATSAPASSAPAASASASGSSSGSASGVPASLTGTAKTIATNWVAFFNPATPIATKATLLQNGSTFSAVLQGEASNAQAKLTSAQVTAVTVSGSTATVTWTLLLSGSPVVANQKGQAVLEGGTWKVGDSAFCGLLKLAGGQLPTACG